jgi:uncharacterized protein (DUF779 family)
MFHQSGGCCDGSTPMCYPAGEFLTGEVDINLADLRVEGVSDVIPLWMSRAQYEYWKHTHLTVDVVEGRAAGSRSRHQRASGSSSARGEPGGAEGLRPALRPVSVHRRWVAKK